MLACCCLCFEFEDELVWLLVWVVVLQLVFVVCFCWSRLLVGVLVYVSSVFGVWF